MNFAIKEAIKPMRDIADENPNAEVFVRVVTFSDGASWHVAQPTEIHNFVWSDVSTGGVTDMGKAFALVAHALSMEKMPQRGLPPVLVLMSDGQPTDDYQSGLKSLMKQPWGKKAVRIAIAIGTSDVDMEALEEFIGNPEIQVLKSDHAADLVKMIKWASTVPLQAASNPRSRGIGDASGGNVPIPAPPAASNPASANDVF